MDFGKHADGTPKTFTDIEAEAMSAALQDDEERAAKRQKRFEGCVVASGGLLGHLWNGWMLMFVVALIGFPLGYWPCVLIAYTVSCIIGSGTWGISTGVAKLVKRFDK